MARSEPRFHSGDAYVARRVEVVTWIVALAFAASLPAALRAQEEGAAGLDTTSVSTTNPHQLPTGYLGITFTCRLKSRWSQDGLAVVHYEYPAVASVEPESPAARAGIQPGDTILAYDNRDVRDHVIVLNKLLQPNTRLAIRLRRNGQLRDVTVSIARRPRDFVDVSVVSPLPPLPPLPPTVPPTAPVGAMTLSSGAAVTAGGDAPPSITVQSRSRGVPWWVLIPPDERVGAFGGAEVVETTPDLRQALGVKGGLLVVVVDPDTPAAESSLRAGDVIVSAGGDAVTTPRQLVRVVERTMRDQNSITLEVERQHHVRHINLQW